jgi:hypothetical protein
MPQFLTNVTTGAANKATAVAVATPGGYLLAVQIWAAIEEVINRDFSSNVDTIAVLAIQTIIGIAAVYFVRNKEKVPTP